nr:MAG TPA: hypothetical protein [Caudoviricetes sp.]
MSTTDFTTENKKSTSAMRSFYRTAEVLIFL